jgi:hypothetical protein
MPVAAGVAGVVGVVVGAGVALLDAPGVVDVVAARSARGMARFWFDFVPDGVGDDDGDAEPLGLGEADPDGDGVTGVVGAGAPEPDNSTRRNRS